MPLARYLNYLVASRLATGLGETILETIPASIENAPYDVSPTVQGITGHA